MNMFCYECSFLTSNKNDLAVAGSSINPTKVRVVERDSLWDVSKPTVHSNQVVRAKSCRCRLQAGIWL